MSSAKEEERKFSETIREKDRRVKEFERRFVLLFFQYSDRYTIRSQFSSSKQLSTKVSITSLSCFSACLKLSLTIRGETRALIGGGGGGEYLCDFIFGQVSCSYPFPL